MPKKKNPALAGTDQRNKSFLYKKATYSAEPSPHKLQELLSQAWKTSAIAKNRRHEINEDDHSAVLATGRQLGEAMDFYEVIAFTPGMDALAAALDLSKDTVELKPFTPSTKSEDNLELVEHTLHFGVSGNHVILMPSGGLRSQHLEEYLNWLLRTTTALTGETVHLANRTLPGATEAVQQVDKITFKTPIKEDAADASPNRGSAKIGQRGAVWAGLKTMLIQLVKSTDLPDDLESGILTAAQKVNVEVSLSWEKSRKNKDKRSEFMDRIASGLRHVDQEVDYSIHTANGATLSKEQIILRTTKGVRCRKERPLKDYLYSAMQTWLRTLLAAGDVS